MNSPEVNQPTPVDREILDRIVKEVFERINPRNTETATYGEILPKEHGLSMQPPKIPIGISVRHAHLCKEDLETLYGSGAELHPMRELYQPGTYAAEETVGIVGPKMRLLEKVRILGPLRDRSQVELAKTDAIYLGINAPLRISGDLKGSAPITIVGPKGVVRMEDGCIRAMRHIHMNMREAEYFGLKNGDRVKLRVGGDTAVTFENVVVRIGENVKLEVHLDTDEGNVADIHCNQEVEIFKNGLIRGSVS